MSDLNMFIPITKVDATQRLVYGVATAEALDRQGEICDYATTKPFYEKWSSDIAKASDGKSLGNVRSMHGSIAAGKITTLKFNDADRQIELCAKIVDDAEWAKVTEGVYTGFSQGGAYVKRWTDDVGHQRYTADPCEVSLVDLPCLQRATFQMIKANGASEQRSFRVQPPNSGGEWEKVFRSKRDGATFSSKAELRKHHKDLNAQALAAAAAGPALGALKTIREALDGKEAPVALVKSQIDEELAKVVAERDVLKKALANMQPQLEEILHRVKKIEQQPVALPYSGQLRAVSKGQDGQRRDPSDPADVIDVFKEAQRNPKHSPLSW